MMLLLFYSCDGGVGIGGDGKSGIDAANTGGSAPLQRDLRCARCGHAVVDVDNLVYVALESDAGHYEYEHTILGRSTMVQGLTNPSGHTFEVVTVTAASVRQFGAPSSEATWSPGRQWTQAHCPQCGGFLGWHFDLDPSARDSDQAYVKQSPVVVPVPPHAAHC